LEAHGESVAPTYNGSLGMQTAESPAGSRPWSGGQGVKPREAERLSALSQPE